MRMFYTIFSSIFIGYFMYLVFEAPFINLGKSMFLSKSATLKSADDIGVRKFAVTDEDNNCDKLKQG